MARRDRRTAGRFRRAAFLAVGAAAGLGLACCELFVDANHLDTGSPSDGAGPRDGHLEGPGDTAVEGDAASRDATAPADGGSFCLSHPTLQFCADFDEDATLFAFPRTWGAPDLVNGSTLTRDYDAWVSPPASLQVLLSTTEGTDAGKSVAKIGTNLSGTVTNFHVAFDMRLDQVDQVTTSEYLPFDVTLGNDSTFFTLYLDIAPNGGIGDSGAAIYYQLFVNNTQVSSTTFALARAPALGQWTHVDIAFTLGADSGVVTTALNDASVLDGAAFATAGANLDPQLELGGAVFAPTQAWGAHFDNFAVSFH